jgi:hypothetical protein
MTSVRSFSIRRHVAAAFALAAVALGSSSLAAAPAIAVHDDVPRVVRCESGVETQGDISISSLTVVRVDPNEVPTVPPGCTVE